MGEVEVPKPGELTVGRPPPERLWANADALKAKMSKTRRNSGDIMTGPQGTFPKVYALDRIVETVMWCYCKDFTNEFANRRHSKTPKRTMRSWSKSVNSLS
jgi:hypothetical protein